MQPERVSTVNCDIFQAPCAERVGCSSERQGSAQIRSALPRPDPVRQGPPIRVLAKR